MHCSAVPHCSTLLYILMLACITLVDGDKTHVRSASGSFSVSSSVSESQPFLLPPLLFFAFSFCSSVIFMISSLMSVDSLSNDSQTFLLMSVMDIPVLIADWTCVLKKSFEYISHGFFARFFCLRNLLTNFAV